MFLRIAILAVLLLPPGASGHGVHAAITMAEYAGQSKSLEVTIVASADDLETVVRRDSGRQVELDRDKDAAKLIFEYIRKSLEFRSAKDLKLDLKWVGMEVSLTRLTAYVEVPLPDGPEGLRVRNVLLFDLLPDQVNIMSVKRNHGGKASDHLFQPGNREFQVVRLPAEKLP